MVASEVCTNRNLVLTTQNKYNIKGQNGQIFRERFNPQVRFSHGFPSPWMRGNRVYGPHIDNRELIKHGNNAEKFKDIISPHKGKLIFNKLSLDFRFLNNIIDVY